MLAECDFEKGADEGWRPNDRSHWRVVRQGDSMVYELTAPILTARDRTLGHGFIGAGSFDDTGAFDDLRLRGIAK